MLQLSQSQRAVFAFFLAVALAVASSAVCIAFGDGEFSWAASGTSPVGEPAEPTRRPLTRARAAAEPAPTAQAVPPASWTLRTLITS